LPEQHDKTSGRTASSFEVRVSMVEVYGEIVRDLLQPPVTSGTSGMAAMGGPDVETGLQLREGPAGVEVVGLEMTEVSSATEALELLETGVLRRATGATKMNVHSSRSHAIFTVNLERRIVSEDEVDGEASGAAGIGDVDALVEVRHSKVHFVDLAGSERQKKTKATGTRMKEGIAINKGLLALGNVISALGDEQKRKRTTHVPYRDSKLTRLLQDALGGNSRTAMIACISPVGTSLEESLNTLRYANRAKNIKNKAKVNVDPKAGIIAALKAEIAQLRLQLAVQPPISVPTSDSQGSPSASHDASPPERSDGPIPAPLHSIPSESEIAMQALLATMMRVAGAKTEDEFADRVADLKASERQLAIANADLDDMQD